MELAEAIEFIRFEPGKGPQVWVDLGCGSGLFTLALANYLAPGSTIYAIDKNDRKLKEIPGHYKGIEIETIPSDFISDAMPLVKADGILMANALHYVADKKLFIHKQVSLLKPSSFLLVDYDRSHPNQWVPYPLPIEEAKTLFNNAGFSSFEELNKRRSVYGDHDMYSALVRL